MRIGIVSGGFGASFQWHHDPDCRVTAAGGRDLNDAYDALERIDGSCHILAARAALDVLDALKSGGAP